MRPRQSTADRRFRTWVSGKVVTVAAGGIARQRHHVGIIENDRAIACLAEDVQGMRQRLARRLACTDHHGDLPHHLRQHLRLGRPQDRCAVEQDDPPGRTGKLRLEHRLGDPARQVFVRAVAAPACRNEQQVRVARPIGYAVEGDIPCQHVEKPGLALEAKTARQVRLLEVAIDQEDPVVVILRQRTRQVIGDETFAIARQCTAHHEDVSTPFGVTPVHRQQAALDDAKLLGDSLGARLRNEQLAALLRIGQRHDASDSLARMFRADPRNDIQGLS
jgi:hypothetical protein